MARPGAHRRAVAGEDARRAEWTIGAAMAAAGGRKRGPGAITRSFRRQDAEAGRVVLAGEFADIPVADPGASALARHGYGLLPLTAAPRALVARCGMGQTRRERRQRGRDERERLPAGNG